MTAAPLPRTTRVGAWVIAKAMVGGGERVAAGGWEGFLSCREKKRSRE